MATERLAVYSTAYPAAAPFLGPWLASLAAQRDRAFTLWLGLDGLSPDAVAEHGPLPGGTACVEAAPHESPSALRFRAMATLADEHEAVVFVDCDDVLHPDRVGAARAQLERLDVAGCALRFVDAAGDALGADFGPARAEEAAALLPDRNVFGLSNTAYRTATLARCLPGPADCPLADWLLATRAWADGAALGFDPAPRMDYRQHGANVARVLPPVTPAMLAHGTALVRRHHAAVLDGPRPLAEPARGRVAAARARVDAFAAWLGRDAAHAPRYLAALAAVPPEATWWWYVAHPALEGLWST